MRKEILATALSTALIASGCGGEKKIEDPVKVEIGDLIAMPEVIDDGSSFDGIQVDQLEETGDSVSSSDASITAYSEAYTPDEANLRIELFKKVQSSLGALIDVMPTANIRVFEQDNDKDLGLEPTKLKKIGGPKVIVLTEEKDFSTHISTTRPEAPRAITYRPTEIPALNRTYSFLARTSDNYMNAWMTSVEACQSSVDVEPQNNPVFKMQFQESYCNSIAPALGSAILGISYEDYRVMALSNRSSQVSNDGRFVVKHFVIGEKAYKKFAKEETPNSSDFQGGQYVDPPDSSK